jgi:hypothetical protein
MRLRPVDWVIVEVFAVVVLTIAAVAVSVRGLSWHHALGFAASSLLLWALFAEEEDW